MKLSVLNNKKFFTKKKKRNLICFTSPDSSISEQFRTIRTNIQIMMGEQKNKTLLLTSSKTDEGKSTILANLAVSLSQQKGKVLLIDANLRNPYIHSIFKFQNTEGLSSVLSSEVDFEKAIKFTGISGLDVLTSGPVPPNPAEVLGSAEMKKLLKSVVESYDMVLIDSPPVLDSAETRILAGLCDGVILLINKGKTLLERATASRKVLEFANAKLIGVILNEK